MTERERARYEASLATLATMRTDRRLSLREAAHRNDVDPRTVQRYVGTALTRERGRLRPLPTDRLTRPMTAFSGGQRVDIDVRGSRAASTIGAYHNAVRQFLETGDEALLRRFAGKTVAGVELEADPETLEEMGRRGVFDFAAIYRLVA